MVSIGQGQQVLSYLKGPYNTPPPSLIGQNIAVPSGNYGFDRQAWSKCFISGRPGWFGKRAVGILTQVDGCCPQPIKKG